MELVYLVNGGESCGGGGGDGTRAAGYPFVKASVSDGAVGIQDRTVTRVELKTSDAVRINFPPRKQAGPRRALEKRASCPELNASSGSKRNFIR